jgi:hypothetical protein
VAQHGDLQLLVIDAHPNDKAEKPAKEAIQEEREHGRGLTDSQTSRQRRTSRPIEFVYPTAVDADRAEGELIYAHCRGFLNVRVHRRGT